MPNSKHYPFHDSLKNALRNIDSPLLGVRLIRSIMMILGISQAETEILIGLAARSEPATFDEVHDIVSHLSKDATKRLLNRLVKNNSVQADSFADDHGFAYSINHTDLNVIKSISKDQLLKKKFEEKFSEAEPVAVSLPPVKKTFVERILDRLTKPCYPLPINPPYPTLSPELDRAMTFCYALLAPGQNANAIIFANPEAAAAAHKAIYERKPQTRYYEEMMVAMAKFPKVDYVN